jgi:hypothetical protein
MRSLLRSLVPCAKTHNTGDCKKYDHQGIEEGVCLKASRNKLKKALKKNAKKNKKRKYADSSNSDSSNSNSE